MYKQNLHTHSTFDHGKDTPEQLLNAAIKMGFDSVGFSGHAYTSYCDTFTMSPEGTKDYIKEIKRLKEEYSDKIKVYLGLEFDMYSDTPTTGYDYIIGACHYLKIGDDYPCVDRDENYYKVMIDEYFGGDGKKLMREYFAQVALLPKFAKVDILAHYDLVAKNIERSNFFDCNSKEYMSLAVEALETLKKDVPFFEINTGGVVRGYRQTPYPMLPLIKEMKRLGYGAVITSDCHDVNYLDAYFDEARELLIEGGFKEKYILTDRGFKAVEL